MYGMHLTMALTACLAIKMTCGQNLVAVLCMYVWNYVILKMFRKTCKLKKCYVGVVY